MGFAHGYHISAFQAFYSLLNADFFRFTTDDSRINGHHPLQFTAHFFRPRSFKWRLVRHQAYGMISFDLNEISSRLLTRTSHGLHPWLSYISLSGLLFTAHRSLFSSHA